MILAKSKGAWEETIYLEATLEAVVKLITEENEDPADYFFYEIDESTKFEVEMKAIRKEVPVKRKI